MSDFCLGINRFSFRIDGGRRLSPALPSCRRLSWRHRLLLKLQRALGEAEWRVGGRSGLKMRKGMSVRERCVEGLSGRLVAQKFGKVSVVFALVDC